MQEGTSPQPSGSEGRPRPERLLVTAATYNERDNLVRLIPEILAIVPNAHILIIDDNSPDGTGRIADEFAAKDPRIHVLHRPGKMGLGTALLAAMRYAMDHDYELMLNLDADFSHPTRFIPQLLAGMDRHDVMIGSRYIPGGGSVDWPFSRRFMSRSVNMLVRLLLRVPVRDASGGYRCYRVARLKQARLDLVRSRGYSFQQEVLYRCLQAGASVGETPIVFENRKHGKSKVSMKESLRSLGMLVRLGVRKMVGLDKRERSQPLRADRSRRGF
jgi:dolichol-phosphate mannosyltransferase